MLVQSSSNDHVRIAMVSALCAAALIGGGFAAEKAAAPGNDAELPTYGISVATPPGWKSPPRTRPKEAIWWISADSTGRDLKATIQIEAGTAAAGTLEERAQALAKMWGGSVAGERTTLGTEPAIRIVVSAPQKDLHPVEAVVAEHGGRSYMLLGAAVGGRSCAKEFELVRSNWKWMEVESAVKHLKLTDAPIPVLDGLLSVSMPASVYRATDVDQYRAFHFGLNNLQRGAVDYRLHAMLVDMPKGTSLSGVRDQIAENIRTGLKLDEPLSWTDGKGGTPRAISQSKMVTLDNKGTGIPVRSRWAIVALDESRAVWINFQIWTDRKADWPEYESLSERILESMKPRER